MNNVLFFLVCLFSAGMLQAQGVNMTLTGHLDYQALHAANLNDCWGYVDETGIEYALVGTSKGTSIVSLADPANPVEVFWLAGPQSIWRDLQVYEDYLYVTTEAEHGLEIIDMSPLPGSNVLPSVVYNGPGGNQWTRAHDIFVDTTGGWAYICGANRGNGGMIILDIHTNPMAPAEVGEFDNWYCHDAFAQGNLLYGAHISDGFFSIVDVTDHANPVLINTQTTPKTFTHNIWVTTNDQYAVTTDEVAGAWLALYDVSNPNTIQEVDRIRSSPGMNTIPHNAFILGDTLIVTSYYTDGLTIHDMSRPHNLVEIASYDTHPLQNGTFNGSWGGYAYLPSGHMLASDISEGLFILNPTLISPSWYEGLVRDASTLDPLPDVSVTIAANPQTDLSDAQGKYAVGTVTSGAQDVTFYKVAYFPQTISVDFASGELLTDTIDLVPMPAFGLTVIVEEAGTGNPVIGADVRVEVPQMMQEGPTNGFGEHAFQLYYTGSTIVTAGKWGYKTACAEYAIDQSTGTITVQLEKGWYDDFSFDFGWTSTADATTGLWERGIPNPVGDNASPPVDAQFDCDRYAMVTGNMADAGSDQDDVDNGTVTLYSPVFDLTAYTDPHLYYERWFFNNHGPALVDDTLKIYLSNGITQVEIDRDFNTGFTIQWEPNSIRVADYLTPTANMQLIVAVSDTGANINVTEAGLDAFSVDEAPILEVPEKMTDALTVYPNPVEDLLFVLAEGKCRILSPDGTVIKESSLKKGEAVDVSGLKAGIYFLAQEGRIARFVKL